MFLRKKKKMDENKRFECPYCGHSFIAHIDEYKTIFKKDITIYEAFCPVCGKHIQVDNGFSGTGGGKF